MTLALPVLHNVSSKRSCEFSFAKLRFAPAATAIVLQIP